MSATCQQVLSVELMMWRSVTPFSAYGGILKIIIAGLAASHDFEIKVNIVLFFMLSFVCISLLSFSFCYLRKEVCRVGRCNIL